MSAMPYSREGSRIATPVVLPSPTNPEIGLCRRFGLCCSSVFLTITLLPSVGCFVARGIIVYLHRNDEFCIKNAGDISVSVLSVSQNCFEWKGLGLGLLGLGAVTFIGVSISVGLLCCFIPWRQNVNSGTNNPPGSRVVLPAQTAYVSPIESNDVAPLLQRDTY
ncbi:hypothetical protein ECG_06207 [Echinococcus granulosus]|uniref:Expressed conserved protein n=1 Tax=Echinococcus granulosus TaxID=6210 RepID=A0A068WPZ7_ECHGR|nr:hypothetical protein ECG_06207 [Echinococcus granulosus]CDS19709.1 hypothetical protein EgrG_000504000 [Echinococcus granulosus]